MRDENATKKEAASVDEFTLWDAGAKVEDIYLQMEEAFNALAIFFEGVEGECPTGDCVEALDAVNFARRFPLYMSSLRMIQNDLHRLHDELKGLSALLYNYSKADSK